MPMPADRTGWHRKDQGLWGSAECLVPLAAGTDSCRAQQAGRVPLTPITASAAFFQGLLLSVCQCGAAFVPPDVAEENPPSPPGSATLEVAQA